MKRIIKNLLITIVLSCTVVCCPMDVVFDIDGTSMIGRCEPSELIEGQPATITFDVAHVFDAGDCGARRGKGG